jgi:hypothetical protein
MKMKLLDFKKITDFPSGSGMEYFDGQVYLAGDDAADILVLDKKWRELQRIKIYDNIEGRIPKSEKADLEATTILYIDEIPHLLVLGSGSRQEHRSKAVLVNLQSNNFTEYNLEPFYTRLQQTGIEELNIESAAVVEDLLILGNRGNRNNPGNQIIITESSFFSDPENVEIRVIPIEIEAEAAGLSGLTYSEKNDSLLFTASTENTSNAYDDGNIGESYFGVVENAYRKLYRKRVKVNDQVMLSEIDESFRGQKIESVCIQSDKRGRLKLHMVADDDLGGSFLFKTQIRLW